ncbi:MAG TPA: CBS domain-containing protein [Candidatus Methylomirabilis sp.]|jgi:CBS domain-containing protein|nr:CBS domain-containing protein [Candidatus Methylomirabilis sp.]
MTLADLMNTKPVTVRPTETVAAAAKRMRDEGVGCVVVTGSTRKPVGILTDRDIVLAVVAEGRLPDATRVEEVMCRHVITGRRSDTLMDAAIKMAEASIRRLPILDGQGRMVGLVSVDDLLVILITELSNISAAIAGPSKILTT